MSELIPSSLADTLDTIRFQQHQHQQQPQQRQQSQSPISSIFDRRVPNTVTHRHPTCGGGGGGSSNNSHHHSDNHDNHHRRHHHHHDDHHHSNGSDLRNSSAKQYFDESSVERSLERIGQQQYGISPAVISDLYHMILVAVYQPEVENIITTDPQDPSKMEWTQRFTESVERNEPVYNSLDQPSGFASFVSSRGVERSISVPKSFIRVIEKVIELETNQRVHHNTSVLQQQQ
jgi:hypothetical protein